MNTGQLKAQDVASVRHNARIILPHVRGKSKADREAIYAGLSLGPFVAPLLAISQVIATQPKRGE